MQVSKFTKESSCFCFQICHSKSGDINPVKIRGLVDAYVEKVIKMRKYVAKKGLTKANGVQIGNK